MFGTIICNKKELTQEEQNKYQAAYCGLCRAIRDKYGQLERMTLNYDMTFLALMLNGLYEECNENIDIRCPVHPLKKRYVLNNKYIDYAADMTILLSYYKCLDDWNDESKRTSKAFAGILKKHMTEIEKNYPRQSECVKNSLKKIEELEKTPNSMPDDIVNYSGTMLSEIFVYEEDFWSDSLRSFGYELGRFIYLMDAVVDYYKDIKENNYNPLLYMNKQPKDIEPLLTQTIGNATNYFEKLPIIQDAGIIRNILYGGVWQAFYKTINGKEEKNGK